MRVIHLGFQLHTAAQSKADFERENQAVFQPFFALMERNLQKTKAWHFSLLVSGPWLEAAEKYDSELIKRLRKIVESRSVELIALPYYQSLAFFYSRPELAEQVKLYREKIRQLFGQEGRVFALPELLYNDEIGKWAEEFGFAGMLVGGSSRVLGWHSPNHVYEAAGCQYLRLLFRNGLLSDKLSMGSADLLVPKKQEDGSEKSVLSVQKFQKLLDLQFLRGNLVNLYFDVRDLAKQREKGVWGFFDELIKKWLEDDQQKFAHAAEACVVETPTMEITVRETVGWHEEDALEPRGGLPVLLKDVECKLPKWLDTGKKKDLGEVVYALRREILASEDEKLIQDYRHLMMADYQMQATFESFAEMQDKLQALKARADEVKKAQVVEISKNFTKKRDRETVEIKAEDSVVKVNFGKRSEGVPSHAVHAATKAEDDDEVIVHRLPKRETVENATIVEAETPEVLETEPKKPSRNVVKKIIRKLVIE